MTSGMSQRFTSPSLLSSVKFATSGVTMLPWKYGVWPGSSHDHFSFGSNEFGGCGGEVHVGALPPTLSGGTWHLSTGGPESALPSSGLNCASNPGPPPSVPPSFPNFGFDPHAITTQTATEQAKRARIPAPPSQFNSIA